MSERMQPSWWDRGRKSKVATGVSTAFRDVMAPLALGLVATVAGCTAMLDGSQSQCSTADDCSERFPDSTYQCVQNVCAQPSCDDDATCRGFGERFASSICDLRIHQCVPGECKELDECGRGRVCNLATNRCVERECQSVTECLTPLKESPTVQCIDGFCVDDKWSCIGQPDNRDRSAGAKGTLEIPLLSVTTERPIAGAVWKARICGSAQQDTASGCATIVNGGTWSYDAATGIMRVTGLDPDLPVRIWLDETAIPDQTGNAPVPAEGGAPRAIIPIEFVTQKPPIGVTRTAAVQVVAWSDEAALRAMYTKGLVSSSVDLTNLIDRTGTKASIFGVAFDCQDMPTSNVQLGYRLLPSGDVTGHSFFFFDGEKHAFTSSGGGGTPRFWTFPNGLVSTLGLPAAANLIVGTQLLVDERMATRTRLIRDNFATRLTHGRMMTMHLYPRDYSKKAQ